MKNVTCPAPPAGPTGDFPAGRPCRSRSMRLAPVIVTAFTVSLTGSSALAFPPVIAPAMAWVTAKLTVVTAVGGGSWTLYEIGDAVCPKCTAKAARVGGDAVRAGGDVAVTQFARGKDAAYRTVGKWSFGARATTPIRGHMPDLHKKQDGLDALCGTPLPALYVGAPWNRRLNPAIEVDHINPRAKGGTDSVENLQLTLGKHNRQKGDRPWGPAERRRYCPL